MELFLFARGGLRVDASVPQGQSVVCETPQVARAEHVEWPARQ